MESLGRFGPGRGGSRRRAPARTAKQTRRGCGGPQRELASPASHLPDPRSDQGVLSNPSEAAMPKRVR